MNGLVELLKGGKSIVYACPNTGITFVWDGKSMIKTYQYSSAIGFYPIDDDIIVTDYSDLPIDIQDAIYLSKRKSEKIMQEMENVSRASFAHM